MNTDPQNITQLIKESTDPLIFKSLIKWKLLDWSLEDWQKILKDEIMEFRIGQFKYTKSPQWERTTKVIKTSFDYFLEHGMSNNCDKWLYFDYKHLSNNLTKCQILRDVGMVFY